MTRSLVTQLLSGFATAVAVAATAFYFTGTLNDELRRPVRFAELEAMREAVKDQEVALAADNARTKALIEQLAALTKTPSPSSSEVARQLILVKHDINNVNAQVTSLHSSVDVLNKSLEADPEKALAVPLLTKDLNDFKTASQHDVDSLRAEMLRAMNSTSG